jgi:hypothetical protein
MITKLQEFTASTASPGCGRSSGPSPDPVPIDRDLMLQVRAGDATALRAMPTSGIDHLEWVDGVTAVSY